MNSINASLEAINESCIEISNSLSKPVRRLFVDVYFTCMYNSSLLFHRPTFSVQIEAGNVPGYLLLAIYATATMYYNTLLSTKARRSNGF
jgi:hypothetical protein